MISASTPNAISGDRQLRLWDYSRWMAANILEQNRGTPIDDLYAYVPQNPAWPEFTPTAASPPRLWCDLFWNNSAAPVEKLIGHAAPRILDIGCGPGTYAPVYQSLFSHLEAYLGIDPVPHDHWQQQSERNSRWQFQVGHAERLSENDVLAQDLIVSTSALEHVERDLDMFANFARFLQRHDRALLQIHLVPGPTLWRDFGPHGYRGYSFRALERIRALYPGSDQAVFVLGGAASKAHQRNWVFDRLRLAPRRWQDRRREPAYQATLLDAVQTDCAQPSTSLANAGFLAILLAWNCKTSLTDAFAGSLLKSAA